MLADKRQTIIDRTIYAIREIESNRTYSALILISSLEQTAYHCGARCLLYLCPKAYLLALCGYDKEAMMVLHQIIELATYARNRRGFYV